MRKGQVMVDMEVERGGNVEGDVKGEIEEVNGVKIVGYIKVKGRIEEREQKIYERKMIEFVEKMVDKERKVMKIEKEEGMVKEKIIKNKGRILNKDLEKEEKEKDEVNEKDEKKKEEKKDDEKNEKKEKEKEEKKKQ